VTPLPEGKLTESLMSPATGPAVQEAPPAAAQVHVQVRLAGKVSLTVAPVA